MNRSILSLSLLLSLFSVGIQAVNPCTFNDAPVQVFGPADGMLNPRWVEYSPDGKLFVVANFGSDYSYGDGNVQIYKVNPSGSLELETTLGNADGVFEPIAARFAPKKNSDCGYCLAVANHTTSNVKIYSIDRTTYAATEVETITVGVGDPISLAFSPDATCLAIGNRSGSSITLYPFDVTTCSVGDSHDNRASGSLPRFLVFSPYGDCLIDSTRLHTVSGCRFTGSPVDLTPNSRFFHGQFNPCTNCLAASNWDSVNGNLHILPFNGCAEQGVAQNIAFSTLDEVPRQVAFSPDGSCLAVAHFGDPFGSPQAPGTKVTIYQFDKNSCTASNPQALPAVALDPVFETPYALTFSPNGNCLAVASSDTGGSGDVFNVDSYLRIFKSTTCVNLCEPCQDGANILCIKK